MKFFFALMTVALLASSAHAQMPGQVGGTGPSDADKFKAADKKRRAEEIDKQYKATIRAVDGPAVKSDPWGGIRSSDPGKKNSN